MALTTISTEQDPVSQDALAVVRSFRRVSWQRIIVDGDGNARCTVTGLRHRRTATVEVPLATAMELRHMGVRTVVRREDSGAD